MLTVGSFLLLIPVLFFLLTMALFLVWFEVMPSSPPHEAFAYIAGCLAIGLSILTSRAVNRKLRGSGTSLHRRCYHCGLKTVDPIAKFCPQCGKIVVGVVRFFSVGDWVMAALISWTFPIIAAQSGGHTFAFYAVMMVLQLVWVLLVMPETKGVPLEQIQKKLGIE